MDPSDKGYYKNELIESKSHLESLNKGMILKTQLLNFFLCFTTVETLFIDYLKLQDAVERDSVEGGDELSKLQVHTREKLLGGVGKLSDQDNQLKDIKKVGYEAQNMLKEGGKNLREQRDYIESAGRYNTKAQNEIHKADRTIRVIRVREFCYKIILYVLIMCLFAS